MTNNSLIVAENSVMYGKALNPQQFIQLLVDCPHIQGLFTYHIPSHLEVKVGDIVSVYFGNQLLNAIAIKLLDRAPDDIDRSKIKDVEDVIISGLFSATYWQLLEQVAIYYQTPLIQVIKVALPPGLLSRSQRRIKLISSLENIPQITPLLNPIARQILTLLQSQKDGDYSWKYLQSKVRNAHRGLTQLTKFNLVESYLEKGKYQTAKLQKYVSLITDLSDEDLTWRQQNILDILRQHNGGMWLTELKDLAKTSDITIKNLADKGCVVIYDQQKLRLNQESGIWQQEQPKELTEAQKLALFSINQVKNYAQILLHGVTGSGKTEVYLQAIAPILKQGKSVLVLVPEIGLTPQLTDRFRVRFSDQVCVYHSALSDGERYDTWRQMLTGIPQIIIGTRSAIFSPLPKLGLIILDEEHDSSFKQDQPAPNYHTRNIAYWRGQLEDFPVILGSATPSLETWVNIQQKNANNKLYLSLPERVQKRSLPPVKIIDMREELRNGNRSIFSHDLQTALTKLQVQKQQGILFIHRRGHSTFVSCRNCGHVMDCPHCDVSLTYHHSSPESEKLLRCHYCNYTALHPKQCPVCNSPYFKNFGSGTQRVIEELNKHFPQLKTIRFDSDTTRNKGSHREIITQFAQGKVDILVGTQMLTKGLDLPQVTLVGVVIADGLLNLADYRSSERTFQTLIQVAGRCGRGEESGQVIIQTYTPEHRVIQAVVSHDYQSFVQDELSARDLLKYPPYGRLILLKFSSKDEQLLELTVDRIAQELAKIRGDDNFEILGPTPAQILRVADRFRWQILLKFPVQDNIKIPDLHQFHQLCPDDVRMAIDIDPLNFY